MSEPKIPLEQRFRVLVEICRASHFAWREAVTRSCPDVDPAAVVKNPANPVFRGSGQAWDSRAVREAELFVGPQYIHVLYGGYDGLVWRIGHVRTRDFRILEPNPYNPIFVPSKDRDAFDCDGVLTPQVIEVGDAYYMVYAGKKGQEWQTGLAKACKL